MTNTIDELDLKSHKGDISGKMRKTRKNIRIDN